MGVNPLLPTCPLNTRFSYAANTGKLGKGSIQNKKRDVFAFADSMVLKKILECPLDCKEIKPVNPKGNQP